MLIGNYSVLTKSPMSYLAGNTANSDTPTRQFSSGRIRNIYFNESMSISEKTSIPNGYQPGYAWMIPQSSGGIGAGQTIDGLGSISFANAAAGFPIDSDLTGTGDITLAQIEWLGIIAATLSTAAAMNIDITALGNQSTILTGNGATTSDLFAAINANSMLTGSGELTQADLLAILAAAADLTTSGQLSGTLAAAFQIAAALTGSGDISLATLTALGNLITALAASGNASGSITALGNQSSDLTGSGTATATNTANGDMSAGLTVTGDLLSTANVASAVWEAVAEYNLTYQQVMQILLAVAAGKTTIIDLGGGTATVTFRNQEDTLDRVTADMAGSERTSVTIDPS